MIQPIQMSRKFGWEGCGGKKPESRSIRESSVCERVDLITGYDWIGVEVSFSISKND